MALLKEFEKNVEVVVEILEDWLEVIEQQFINEDLGISQTIEGITVKTSLGKGLKEKALNDVSVAMFFGSCLWKNSFNEILMWLNRYMPQFRSQIERQYSKIVNRLNAILSAQHDLQGIGLHGLQDEIGRLANDLRYCAKMAREELATEKPAGTEKETKSVKKTKKVKQSKKKFKPWADSNDACFVIENNRIKFNYKDKLKNLKLKNESHTHRLLYLLSSGSLQPAEIVEKICPNTTNKAAKVVDYANKLLNKKIAAVGFTSVPNNTEFIKRDKYGHYFSSLNIFSKKEFEDRQFQSN